MLVFLIVLCMVLAIGFFRARKRTVGILVSVGAVFLLLVRIGSSGFGSLSTEREESQRQGMRSTTATSSSSWSRLRVGLRVYTDDDGGGVTSLTVCPTLAEYSSFEDGNSVAACLNKRRGLAAVIRIIVPEPTSADAGSSSPHVLLSATDGSWQGYTTAAGLQPVVPIGTIAVMAASGSTTLNLAPTQVAAADAGPNIGERAVVRILRYDPATESRALYVQVLDGAFADRRGWMFASDGAAEDGASLDGVTYDVPAPRPSTNPMNRTYVLAGMIRAFLDPTTCDDVFNRDPISNDDAYQRLNDAVRLRQYHDFQKGDALRVMYDPDPNGEWVMVRDEHGYQGCVSRDNLGWYQ